VNPPEYTRLNILSDIHYVESQFLAVNPEVPASIPGATKFFE
jgi:hypothetical protein